MAAPHINRRRRIANKGQQRAMIIAESIKDAAEKTVEVATKVAEKVTELHCQSREALLMLLVH